MPQPHQTHTWPFKTADGETLMAVRTKRSTLGTHVWTDDGDCYVRPQGQQANQFTKVEDSTDVMADKSAEIEAGMEDANDEIEPSGDDQGQDLDKEMAREDLEKQAHGNVIDPDAAETAHATGTAGFEADPGIPAVPADEVLPTDHEGDTVYEDEVAVDATPAAREEAAEKGVDLTSVEGTGAGGRITKGDVDAAA